MNTTSSGDSVSCVAQSDCRSTVAPHGAVGPVVRGDGERRYQCCGGVMASPSSAVLRPGDWVSFDGADHQVVGLAGVSVRLRSTSGAEMVVLVFISAGLAHVRGDRRGAGAGGGTVRAAGRPARGVLQAAREWQRHIHEVETGLQPDAPPGTTPRPEYDPAATTVRQREATKAGELGVGARTVARMRARYAGQGLWGGGSARRGTDDGHRPGRRPAGRRGPGGDRR